MYGHNKLTNIEAILSSCTSNGASTGAGATGSTEIGGGGRIGGATSLTGAGTTGSAAIGSSGGRGGATFPTGAGTTGSAAIRGGGGKGGGS
jgi:hypothetical protein